MPHEKFEGKKRLVTSREANRMKVANYGKWYLKPSLFEMKVQRINRDLRKMNQALGVIEDK